MSGRVFLLGAFVLLTSQLAICACPNTTGFTRFAAVPALNVVNGNVTVLAGQKILIDQSTPRLYSLIINGTVIVANANIQINTTYIKINDGGSLTAGSDDCPVTNKVVFTFVGPTQPDGEIGRDTDNTLMGSKGLAVLNGGSVELFGWKSGPSWARLSTTAPKNATSITLEKAVEWKVGSQIVIASTDFSEVFDYRNYTDGGPYSIWRGQYAPDQSEMRTIVSVDATKKVIGLDRPLTFLHFGESFMNAEVGLLTRQIVLQGEEESLSSGFGGHFMMRKGPSMKLSGIEVTRMGQAGVLARYPIHFHNARDVYGLNYTLLDSSIHHNYQRCLTIHETHGVVVKNNVAFDTYGHCYFLEDGGERGNIFDSNIGVTARPVGKTTTDNKQIIPSDIKPAIFWITNPNNTFVNNVAVGGWFGYWFALPLVPLALGGTFYSANDTLVRPRWSPLAAFDDNVAHSVADTGVEIDTFLNPDGTVQEFSGSYTPRQPPYNRTDNNYPVLMPHFKRYIGYKCREFAVWGESNMHWSDLKLADNGQAFMVNGLTMLENSLIIGESDNIGNPTVQSGLNRTRPSRWNSLDLLIGHSSYDNSAPQYSRNNTFVNFTSVAGRPAAAYACLRNGPFVHPPKNQLMMNTYVNANQIFVRYLTNSQNDNEWGFVVLDVDGTTTGIKDGAWIVSNNSHARRPDCTYRPEWQAYVCNLTRDTLVKLRFDGLNGQFNFTYNGVAQDVPKLTNKIYTASWHKLGNSLQDGWFMSGNRISGTTWINGLNVLTKRGYAIRYVYTNSTNPATAKWIDTPPKITINLEGFGSGDWIVAAVPYPAGTTFNVTNTQYPYNAFTMAPSLNELVPSTYYWDPATKHLYVIFLDTNVGTSFNFWWNVTTFFDYASVSVSASCNPCSPDAATLSAIPPMPTISLGSEEETYQADLRSCQVVDDLTYSDSTGTAYFSFYKDLVGTRARLTYNIYHSALGARRIRLMKGAVGVEGEVVATRNITGVTAATKGIFSLTRNQWEDLATGKLYVSVEGATSDVRYLRGQILCTSPGKCSLPHGADSPINCNPSYETMPIFSDFLWNGTTFRSKDNKNQTWSINETSLAACGSRSIRTNWPQNIGFEFQYNKYAVNISKWKSLEFYSRLAPGAASELTFSIQCGGPNATGSWTAFAPSLNVKADYVQNYVIDDSGWTLVRIPLVDLGFTSARSQLSSLYFFSSSVFKDTYLDEIRFSTETASLFSKPNTNTVAPYSSSLCSPRITTSRSLTTSPMTTKPMTTRPVTSSPMTTKPPTTSQMTTRPVTSSPMTTKPMTTKPMTSSQMTTRPVTSSPMTTKPMTSSRPLTTSLQSQAMTTKPMTSSRPLTTSPQSQAMTTSRALTTSPDQPLTTSTRAIATTSVPVQSSTTSQPQPQTTTSRAATTSKLDEGSNPIGGSTSNPNGGNSGDHASSGSQNFACIASFIVAALLFI